MKRLLVVVLAVIGVIPVATGILDVVAGPTMTPGGGPTTPSVDSEFRFAHVYWLAAGVILWWSLHRAAERALVTRVVLVIASLGGLARLLSIAVVGWPHPVFIGALVLELAILPLIIWWHARVFPVRARAVVEPPQA